MKEYYLIEQEDTYTDGDIYESYKKALKNYKKSLDDLSNYQYQINKDKVYTLSKVVFDSTTDEKEFYTLKSISIKDYKNLDSNERETFLLSMEEDYGMEM